MPIYALGINPGHGFCKGVILCEDGTEKKGATFPSLVVPDPGDIGGLVDTPFVTVNGNRYWTGHYAEAIQGPKTMTGLERLEDSVFLPALIMGLLQELGFPPENGKRSPVVYGTSGLPGEWSRNKTRCQMLASHIRRAYPFPEKTLSIIGEPLGLAYSVLLNEFGEFIDAARGTVAVIDIGFATVDTCEIVNEGKRIDPNTLFTYELGAKKGMTRFCSNLSSHLGGRYLTLHEANNAARSGYIMSAGQREELPPNWQKPFWETGRELVARLKDAWGNGRQFDTIILGGGGAEQPWYVEPLRDAFPHLVIPEEPQRAIARGFARRARRMANEAN